MKKFKISHVISIITIIFCVAYLIFGQGIRMHNKLKNMDYDKANEITKGFKSYAMTIDTILTLDGKDGKKQNAMTQKIELDDSIYKVSTEVTTTDVTNGAVSMQENSYMYHLNNYYYDYPGVKYKSPITKAEAMANLTNLANIISFDYSQMADLTKEYDDKNKCVTFHFTIGYEDVSEHVKTLLQSAAQTFKGVNFKPVDIFASATVNDAKIVTERDLYIEYEGDGGESIVIEIYTSLAESSPHLTAPNDSEYVNIEE
ncbi:MAG: hypothetical protein IJC69_07315 [Clostridia bacterium]|nr:hypothetical protein [Clostridia bacterium]